MHMYDSQKEIHIHAYISFIIIKCLLKFYDYDMRNDVMGKQIYTTESNTFIFKGTLHFEHFIASSGIEFSLKLKPILIRQ